MRKGFTLLELIIVVIIIGVLSSLAIPRFLNAVEKAKAAKAKNAMVLIAKAAKMYAAESDANVYPSINDGNFSATDGSGLGHLIEMVEIDNDSDWDYTLTGGDDTYTIEAKRKTGRFADSTITLDQDGKWEYDEVVWGQ
ncbi:MAG: hypothetical protein DRP74_06005 [Candidatus Omnitrophota bacterium]|nr:MAG: hypothetical protein DRP74_06005 [Candidatus Omnitrophota bacterium]